jgi:uncharacterized protein
MSRALRTGMFPALFVVSCVSAARAQTPPPEPPAVIAQAEATLRKAPDLARVSIATEARDNKAADARRKGAEAMTAVQAAIRGVGIPADAIQTSGFSLVPDMDYSGGKPSVRGYVVRNQIDVRVDDLDKLADVIDAANSPKNVTITVANPRFELKSRDAAEIEAVTVAVKTAFARAEALAAGTGHSLGPVIKIQQGQVYTTTPSTPTFRAAVGGRGGAGMEAMPIAAPETPITPGELEIHAQVTITVAIK